MFVIVGVICLIVFFCCLWFGVVRCSLFVVAYSLCVVCCLFCELLFRCVVDL